MSVNSASRVPVALQERSARDADLPAVREESDVDNRGVAAFAVVADVQPDKAGDIAIRRR